MATWLFFVSFIVIFIGVLLIAFGSFSSSGVASGGAIILIGPIPIVLGNGPYSAGLVAVGALLTIAALVFFFVLRKRS